MINYKQYLPKSTLLLIEQIFCILLPYGESRLVGGCVRDMLLDNVVKDIDIATQALPKQVIESLTNAGFKCLKTGFEFGSVFATKDGCKFEITTLRADISSDGRYPKVVFTRDWQQDALRRDFTFNALYMNLDGEIYDYHNGIEDLHRKCIKFIGDPALRIKEDYLRILRYFRFYSYFNNSNIDQLSLNSCMKLAKNIVKLSPQRRHQEFFKILSSANLSYTLNLMQELKVLHYLLPIKKDIAFDSFNFGIDPLINLCAIVKVLNLTKDDIINIGLQLVFTKAQKLTITALTQVIDLKPSDKIYEHYKLLYNFGSNAYQNYINMMKIIYHNQGITMLEDLSLPKCPINGKDLIELGLPLTNIKTMLASLADVWIKSNFKFDKSKLIEIARQNLNDLTN